MQHIARIAYCAEQFDNDGSLLSSIIKNLKRVMAAEYSRELSAKVYAGQANIVRRGYRHGSPVGYGLIREAVDETDQPRCRLKPGERKWLQSDHVRVRPGSAEEITIVRWIFQQCLKNRSDACIARELNQGGVPGSTVALGMRITCAEYCRMKEIPEMRCTISAFFSRQFRLADWRGPA